MLGTGAIAFDGADIDGGFAAHDFVRAESFGFVVFCYGVLIGVVVAVPVAMLADAAAGFVDAGVANDPGARVASPLG